MAELTLFTAVKPFDDPDTARHQRNALRSWCALGRAVEVLVIGEETGAAEAAHRAGAELIPEVERTGSGTPTIRSLFEQARRASLSPLLGYVNADILLLDDFLPAVEASAAAGSRFLLVSRRWDLPVRDELELAAGWQDRLRARLEKEGRLHPPAGSDVFVFPRSCFVEVPPLAVGRAGWDNWMIFEARRRGWPVIDLSPACTLIHQDHDYRHLPGGRPHYRHLESDANLRLAGGRAAAFTLRDADWTLDGNRPRPRRVGERGVWRSLEVWLLLRAGSWGRKVIWACFHPRRAAGAVLGWVDWKRSTLRGASAPGGGRSA